MYHVGHEVRLHHAVRLPYWYMSLLDGARCQGLNLGVSNKASAGRGDRAAAVQGGAACTNIRCCVVIVIGAAADSGVPSPYVKQ